MEKIKDAKVNHVVLDCLHTMMFMSINLGKTIKYFTACGKENVMDTFYNFKLNDAWTRYF
jgi:hypothetical protein